MNKVYYFTNIFPHYRKPLWREILKSKNFDLKIFYSKNNPIGIKYEKDDETNRWIEQGRVIENNGFWLFKKFLVWQSGVLKNSFFGTYDSIIILGEVNIISNWIAAIIARLRNKKVIIWGHGLYGGENLIKSTIRELFYKLAHFNLTYENRGKELMIRKGFCENKIKVIYNSLDYNYQSKIYNDLKINTENPFNYFDNNNLPVFLFVGRLTNQKKIDLLIKAILKLNSQKIICNLLIIGDGPQLEYLKATAILGIKKKFIYFFGHCYDEVLLGKFFYKSRATISPGNIGLTGIHSFSYGTPVITHDNFNNQMPEVESIKDGLNGFFFKEDSLEDLIKCIEKVVKSKIYFEPYCRMVVEKNYNPTYQNKILNEVIGEN